MAVYELRTFADIIAAIREEMAIQESDTTTINRIKRDINIVYMNEVVPFEGWQWLRGSKDVLLESYINTGTATSSLNSAVITLSSSISMSVRGYWFSFDNETARYKVAQHAAGSSTIVLESPYTGTSVTPSSYKLWTDRVVLPSNCRDVIEVTSDKRREPLEGCGLQKFRKYSIPLPKSESDPGFYSTGDLIDPNPYSVVSGLPSAVSRSSNGLVKTLTFASDVSSFFPVGTRIEVSGAADDDYNVESVVSSVSSASISYTAVLAQNESVSADVSFVVRTLTNKQDNELFREMLVYPSVNSGRTLLHVDYTKDVAPLENDDDEPLIPLRDRIILVYGALAKRWAAKRNPEEGARNQALFDRKLAKMAGKMDDSTDTPVIRPSRVYLATKRANRYGSERFNPTNISASGSSPGPVYGTPLRLAYFNSSGNLDSSQVTVDSSGNLIGGTVSFDSISATHLSVTSTSALNLVTANSVSASYLSVASASALTSVSAVYLAVTSTSSLNLATVTSLSASYLSVTSAASMASVSITYLNVASAAVFSGTLNCTVSAATFATVDVQGNLTIGQNNSHTVTINADIGSDIMPNNATQYDIGATSNRWRTGYFNAIDSNILLVGISANTSLLVSSTSTLSLVTASSVSATYLSVTSTSALNIATVNSVSAVYLNVTSTAVIGSSTGSVTHTIYGGVVAFTRATAGDAIFAVTNTDTTATTSDSIIRARTSLAGGDALFTADQNGGEAWSWGIDSSDSNSWVLSNASSALGTSNRLKAGTDGRIHIGTPGGTARHVLNIGNATAGTASLTLTNGPSGTSVSANPTYWLQFSNGTVSIVIPAWIGA